MPKQKKKRKKRPQKRRNPRKAYRDHRSEWEGVWYNRADGKKAEVRNVPTSGDFPVHIRLPVRTPDHPGVLLTLEGKIIWCDVDFLREKFSRVPVPKEGVSDAGCASDVGSGPEPELDADRGDDGR